MLHEITEWENDTVRLVKLSGLPRHRSFPYGTKGQRGGRYIELREREIAAVVVHQTAGSKRDGTDAALAVARFATADPRYHRDATGAVVTRKTRRGQQPVRSGGGRGWPGAPYTFVVPYRPAVVDNRLVVYRCWDDQWHTWHTSRYWNRRSVAVAFSGSFRSRHAPRWSETAGEPEVLQLEAGKALILDYLLPRYGLSPETGLIGHFDAGKAACPGDTLEAWTRHTRGEESVDWVPESDAEDSRPLDTWSERQAALHETGYDPGPIDGHWGWRTRSAVEAFQFDHGLVVDGLWGPRTEQAMRQALA